MSDDAKQILLAEGSASLASMVRSGLEKAGFAVTCVEDGRDVLDKVSETSFDLVIADYEMRDTVGAEICRSLKQNKQSAGLPLIVTAAAGLTDLDALKQELNLVAAIKKPLSVRELVATVQSELGS